MFAKQTLKYRIHYTMKIMSDIHWDETTKYSKIR